MRFSEMLESLGQAVPSMIGVPPQWAPAPGKYQTGSRVTKGGSVWECKATNNAGYAGCNDAAYGPQFNSPEWSYVASFPANGLAVPETKWVPGVNRPYGPGMRVLHQSNVFECVDASKCMAGEMPGYSTGWKQLTAGSVYIIPPNPVPAPAAAVTVAPVPVAAAPKPVPVVTPAPAAVPEVIMSPVAATTKLAPTAAPLAPAVATSASAAAATAAATAATTAATTAAVAPTALIEPKVPFYQRPEVFAGALALIGAGWWYYSKRR